MPVISTNLAANSAVRYLNINSASQTSSLSKLASGSRITQASDDAAGLAISTKISSDVSALSQAATNASHGISVLQTADGGASNISDILQRMKALASQSSSGTVTDNERKYIDAEFQQLIDEVDAIAVGTRYNGQSLLDGTSAFAAGAGGVGGGIDVVVGSDADDIIRVTLDTLSASGLALLGTEGVSAAGVDGGAGAVAAIMTGNASVVAPLVPLGLGEFLGIGAETINFADGVTYTAQDIADAITAQSALWDAEINGGGVLVLTQKAGTEATLGGAPTLTDGAGLIDLTSLGVLGNTFGEGTPGAAAAAAVLTGGTAGITITKATSFEVNDTVVTLSATGGAAGDGVYSAQDIVDAITAAAPTGVTASLVAGALTLTSTAAGVAAEVTVGNFSSGTAATILGIAGGAPFTVDGLSAASQPDAITAIGVLDTALTTVSSARANIGSLESRFGFHQASIATSIENLTAAVSAIKDTDVAQEAAKLASSKVKTQAAVAAAAQASQMPQDLLKLLQ